MTAKSHILSAGPIVFAPLLYLAKHNHLGVFEILNIHNEITLVLFFYSVLVGALLPDIDEPNSSIGRKTIGLSNILNIIFGHRGITHSLLFFLFFVAMAFFSDGLFKVFLFGISFGVFAHTIGDMITKETTSSFFYPLKQTIVLLPEAFRFKTNGLVENFFIIPLLIIFNIYLAASFYEQYIAQASTMQACIFHSGNCYAKA